MRNPAETFIKPPTLEDVDRAIQQSLGGNRIAMICGDGTISPKITEDIKALVRSSASAKDFVKKFEAYKTELRFDDMNQSHVHMIRAVVDTAIGPSNAGTTIRKYFLHKKP